MTLTLAPVQQPAGLERLQAMEQQAKILLQSGLLRKGIDSTNKIMAIMMMASELGLPPMIALQHMYVIDGKPCCSATLLAALVYRDQGDNALQVVDSNDQGCTVQYKRKDWPQARQYSFTMDDARRARLAAKPGPWQLYPAAMLRARAISAVCTMAFQDSTLGLYTPEELGAEVTVDAEGNVEVVEAPQIAAPVATTSVWTNAQKQEFARSLAASTGKNANDLREMLGWGLHREAIDEFLAYATEKHPEPVDVPQVLAWVKARVRENQPIPYSRATSECDLCGVVGELEWRGGEWRCVNQQTCEPLEDELDALDVQPELLPDVE